MDVLAALRTFVRVAEAGSFSAVAREMGATQPAISRQVGALEQHLDARLIQRTTRSLTLTEDGRDLLGHARRVLDCVEEAEAAIGRRQGTPSGLVRLTTPATFGRLYVAPRMRRLLDRYPDLSVELYMSDSPTDLIASGMDLAIRGGPVTEASLVARRIAGSARYVVASAEYLARNGTPLHPDDLARHSCVIFLQNAAPNEWRFQGPGGPVTVTVAGRFRTDSSEGIRAAVAAGIGLALAPAWVFGDDLITGNVRAVLEPFQAEQVAIHAVYPSRRNLAPRTRAVIDFLVDEFRLDPAISTYGET
ncbi:MAG: LysR family transcriptional regulator [Gemmatimonadaceae bacterium]|nr:LysR family transcriptional regulator [Acetobacteraceae bacterium]